MPKMRRTMALVSLILLCAGVVFADPIPADLTGTRWVGSGITATEGWLHDGFTLTWNITPAAGGYNYSYTLNPTGQGAVSHFILEVSLTVTADNYRDYFRFSDEIVGPMLFKPGPSNPNMPGDIWGFKFDFGGDPITYAFFSTKSPIWGDFFAKDGVHGQAWNTGFGSDPTATESPFTNWIATPDTQTVIPEPASLLLLGTGLAALVGIARRRRQ